MRWTTVPVLVLAAVLAGCGSEADVGDDEPVPASTATVAPLGTDPYVVRDALVERVTAEGGVRVSVSGRPAVTGLDLVYDVDERAFARRFVWEADGQAMDLTELATGRVCANRAAGRALEGDGSSAMGYLAPSDLPYSCTTRRDNLAGFLIFGYSTLDPVTRLSRLMGDVRLTDLGAVTDQDDVATRHVRITATESDMSLRPAVSTYDLWVDGDMRLVRAEYSSLDQDLGPYVATFDYGDPATIELPAAAERGGFTFHPGVGHGTVHPPA